MANRIKFIKRGSPDLASLINAEAKLLWGTAGRLNGLEVTDVTGTGPYTISLNPGAYFHDGITVKETVGFTVSVPAPAAYSLTVPLYLVVQSGGFDENIAPTWSLISKTAYEAQADHLNYAAVIARYDYKLPANEIEYPITIGEVSATSGNHAFAGYSDATTPTGSEATKNDILNGGLNAEARIRATSTGTPIFELYTISDLLPPQVAAVRSMNVSFLAAASTTAATQGAGVVVVTAAGTRLAGESYSILLNGYEYRWTSQAGAESTNTIAQGLTDAINGVVATGVYTSLSGLATAVNAGSGVINITSVSYGQLGLLELQTSKNAAVANTTTLATTAFTGGAQAYLVVDFVQSDDNAVASAVYPMTVYPPVAANASSTGVFTVIEVPFDVGGMSQASFNSLWLRFKLVGPSTSYVDIASATIHITYGETGDAIDATPPLNLTHWSTAPSVSVGGGGDTGLTSHRTARPIDHPDRSVTRQKIALGAVGVSEIDKGVVGTFVPHTHVASDNTLAASPWLVSGDFSLKEQSDLLKEVASTVSGTSGVSTLFPKDHSATTGHHKSSTYATLIAGTAGTKIEKLSVADHSADGSTVTPLADTQYSQVLVEGETATKSAILYTRKTTHGSAANVAVFGITSGIIGAVADPSKDFALEVAIDGSQRYVWFSRQGGGADIWGVRKIGGVAISSLGGRKNLFTGDLIFMRGDLNISGNPTGYIAPGGGSYIYGASGTSQMADGVNTGSDLTGNFQTITNSRNSNPTGYVCYTDMNNVLNASQEVDSIFQNGTFGNYTPAYLYLPFTSPGEYSKISVRLTGSTRGRAFQPYPWRWGYCISSGVFPAYDVAKIYAGFPAFSLTAPTNPGRSANLNKIPSGIVRRNPWVLTPSYATPGTPSVDPAAGPYDRVGRRVNCFYNSSGGGTDFFTGTPTVRTPFPYPAGTNWNDDEIYENKYKHVLPYYDKVAAGSPGSGNTGGVVFDLSQGRIMSQNFHMISDPAYPDVYYPCAMEFSLDLTNVNLATAGSRQPDGIVIATSAFDPGLLGGSPYSIPATTNGWWVNLHVAVDSENTVSGSIHGP